MLQYTLANDIATHMCPISSGPLIHQIMHIQCQSIVGVDGSVTTSSYEVSRLFTDFGMMSENSILKKIIIFIQNFMALEVS